MSDIVGLTEAIRTLAPYGVCTHCGSPLAPIWFTEREYGRNNIPTGRKRTAVDYLLCESCGHRECVDDTFDGPWHY